MLISYYANKKSSPRLPSWQPSLIFFNIPIDSGSIIKPCTLKHFQVTYRLHKAGYWTKKISGNCDLWFTTECPQQLNGCFSTFSVLSYTIIARIIHMVCSLLCFVVIRHPLILTIFVRIISQLPGQSYECPSANNEILKCIDEYIISIIWGLII